MIRGAGLSLGRMCTIIAAVGMFPGVPLLVAGNRDEKLDRPSVGPRVLGTDPLVVGPRDELAGGTWIAVSARGVVAALTNRFVGAPPDPRRASRGALVDEAARAPSAAEMFAGLEGLAPERYNPFHLLVGDRGGAYVVACDGARVWRRALAPGLHVLTERSDGEEPSPRIEWARSLWEGLAKPPDARDLHRLLGHHDPADPMRALCVHLEELGYGTRSTTVIALGERIAFWHAEGPACTSELEREDDLETALSAP